MKTKSTKSYGNSHNLKPLTKKEAKAVNAVGCMVSLNEFMKEVGKRRADNFQQKYIISAWVILFHGDLRISCANGIWTIPVIFDTKNKAMSQLYLSPIHKELSVKKVKITIK